jgi:hypothetical protein
MNIVQIRYTKYHSSGDKAQINIEYIFTMCMILQRKNTKRQEKTLYKQQQQQQQQKIYK